MGATTLKQQAVITQQSGECQASLKPAKVLKFLPKPPIRACSNIILNLVLKK